MKKIMLLAMALVLIHICDAQMTKKIDWHQDIDFIAKELPQKHHDFFTMKNKRDFLTGLQRIKERANELTDLEVSLRLQQLIAAFGDSHTKINFGQFIDRRKILPLQLYWFSDGLYILQTTHENREILAHRIMSINGTPLKTVADSLSTLVTADNAAIVKTAVPTLLPLVEILEYFGFVNEHRIQLLLEDTNGNPRTYIVDVTALTTENREIFKPDSLALCFKNEKAFFNDFYLESDKTYYLQYNRCWSKELELQYGNAKNAGKLPSFKEFEDKVFKVLADASIEKIVFDLRFNQGGNSKQGTDFIELLSKYLERNSGVKMYAIIGRQTFSSGILNALDLKRLTNATFVGEDTAGKPNHFGEVRNFQLPASGARVDYSTKYFQRTETTTSTLSPDIRCETSFSDFNRGIDPAYEWIKRQKSN